MLTPEMISNLKAELSNDPTARGYSETDNAGKAQLFNNPYTVPVTTDVEKPARVSQVLTQAFAPNAITEEDIAAALAS
ncbi:hypothetical protein BH10PLA2_BH10PLA2_00600 [soil metagenome]